MTQSDIERATEWMRAFSAFIDADDDERAIDGIKRHLGTRPVTFMELAPILVMIRGMNQRNKQREARITALETRPSLEHRGVWNEEHSYGAGSLVTYKGGLWLAGRLTAARPGTSDSGWRLIVKSGGAE